MITVIKKYMIFGLFVFSVAQKSVKAADTSLFTPPAVRTAAAHFVMSHYGKLFAVSMGLFGISMGLGSVERKRLAKRQHSVFKTSGQREPNKKINEDWTLKVLMMLGSATGLTGFACLLGSISGFCAW